MKEIIETTTIVKKHHVGDESVTNQHKICRIISEETSSTEQEVVLPPDLLKKAWGGGRITTQYDERRVLIKSSPIDGRVASAWSYEAEEDTFNLRLEYIDAEDWIYAWVSPDKYGIEEVNLDVASLMGKLWLVDGVVPEGWGKIVNKYYGV